MKIRSIILFIKNIFAILHAYLWTRIIIILIMPNIHNIGVFRSILISFILFGFCALVLKCGVDTFVGRSVNPNSYSMDHDSFFALQFNTIVYSIITLLFISLLLQKFVFLNFDKAQWGLKNIYWNGFYIDLPIYMVLFLFLMFHRRFYISKKIMNDRSTVFNLNVSRN